MRGIERIRGSFAIRRNKKISLEGVGGSVKRERERFPWEADFVRSAWWFMRSARSRGRGQKRRLNYVPDANVGRIVRCRRRAPSIFQLPWKFRSWETRFASVHTLNNVAVQSATAPSLLSFLSLPKKRAGGEGKERKERNKNKKMGVGDSSPR